MDEVDKLLTEIVNTLKSELPQQYENALYEFEKLVKRDLYRASFSVLDELKKKNDWHPSVKLIGLIEKYQIIF